MHECHSRVTGRMWTTNLYPQHLRLGEQKWQEPVCMLFHHHVHHVFTVRLHDTTRASSSPPTQ